MDFGAGDFVAGGTAGGTSISTCRVGAGEGNAGAFLLLFSFVLTLAFRLTPGAWLGFSVGEGDAEILALTFGFAFGLMAPPEGIPDSARPVGELAGSTGWLFGSAANVEPSGVAVAG